MTVDAACEADERVDRGEDENDGERMFPERNADERAAGGHDQRRGQREDREQVRKKPVHIGGNCDVADEIKLVENNLDWSPTGGLIAFDRGGTWGPGHVCVLKPDGSGLRDLNPKRRTLFQQPWQPPYKVFSEEPDWSPDGRRIAFSYFDPYYGLGDVWIMNANGKGLVKLTHNWMEDRSPDWSPDGRRIAYVRSARYARKSEIVVMNVDGSGKKALTDGEFDDRSPAWQPVVS